MVALTSPVLRALTGLADGSGRTLVVAGPPTSGKSRLLADMRARLEATGCEVHQLHGTYRDRDTPLALVAPLESRSPVVEESVPSPDPESDSLSQEVVPPLASPLAFLPEEAPAGRRSRGGERRKGTILGQTYVTRPRAAAALDATSYWHELTARFRSGARSCAILVDDATFADAESREFLLHLSERARLRPLLIVLVLDAAVPAFRSWEERLLGRGDVDWVRIQRGRPDPREAHRLKEMFEKLPASARRVVGYTALMDGSVSEVGLSRITRMSWPKLADALLPATEAGLLKLEGDRVVIPHTDWIDVVPELLGEHLRSEMHREVAEALAALNPEPSLQRRLELADHFYRWYRGPMALRYLLETAELTERLHAYDTAEEVLAKALHCVPSLPAVDRSEAEAEIRLFRTRVLVVTGRLPEAERELREGVTAAVHGKLASERVEEWVEVLVPILRAVGPRPSLHTELVELADRCHDAGYLSVEILFQYLIVEFEVERLRTQKGRVEAERAGTLAKPIGPGPVQALAMAAVGVSRLDGNPFERELAGKFLRSASTMLRNARRYPLEQQVEEIAVRLLELQGERAPALRARERAIPVVVRTRALPIELNHQLGIATLLLEGNPDARIDAALKRAREITELLHLLPPSPGLLRLWLTEGRHFAVTQRLDGARELWSALVDLPAALAPPRIRAEAILRLAILEAGDGREEAARGLLVRLSEPELARAMRPEWSEWADQVRSRLGTPAAA
ncbi:MAG: ATP-binding protein [Thermoplasmata archaeon]|nr:ATP-binding protein [Thermoplasmata archaeon]